MAKETYYRQCALERKISEKAFSRQVAWIPEQYCKEGKILKIKDQNDEWVDGWEVKTVGQDLVSEKDAPDAHKAIKGHRKATGDSMAKVH